ncbi:MAG: HIRAN domain-containing protein [Magnetococcales bacterium]|nr:HIRAN domain-containing protein [Magnetococcales bacterium]
MNLSKRRFLKAGAGVAGFQDHQGQRVWSQLRIGQSLILQREADNPYDGKAVMVLWNGRKLGYVPRASNVAVSQMLDRGQNLRARIARLKDSSNPWERIQVDILMETRPGRA